MVEHGGQPDLLRLDHARASYFLVAHFRGGQELLELFIGGAARAEEPAAGADSPVFVLFAATRGDSSRALPGSCCSILRARWAAGTPHMPPRPGTAGMERQHATWAAALLGRLPRLPSTRLGQAGRLRTGTQQLWPSQVGSWSEVAQTTIKWRRNGRRFVHTTARPYHPPFRPFRRHPNAVRSLLKPVETAGGC